MISVLASAARWSLGDLLLAVLLAPFVIFGITFFLLLSGCSLILLKADGDGKLVSLLKLTELSLPMDRALLKPLELDVRLPKPLRTSRKGGAGGAAIARPGVMERCGPGRKLFTLDFARAGLGMALLPTWRAGLGGTEGILGVLAPPPRGEPAGPWG